MAVTIDKVLPDDAWALTGSVFLVPASPFQDSDLDRQVHADIQRIIMLIYGMLACGMDMYTIKTRLLGIE